MARKNILLLVLLCVCSWKILASDIELIEQVFQRYRSALLQNNGKEALAEVDSGTVRYYDDAIYDALNMSRSELDRQDLLSRLMILRLRHVFRITQLQEMTGESLFIYSIENNWIDRSHISENSKLMNIKIRENIAKAALSEVPDYPIFTFIKENGIWKLSLLKAFEMIRMLFSKVQKDSGLEEDEFLILLLEKVSGSEVDKKIFEGPSDGDRIVTQDTLKENSSIDENLNGLASNLRNSDSAYEDSLYMFFLGERAEVDDDMAQLTLANSYREGKRVRENPKKALYWYRRAMENGNIDATYNLGYAYLIGYGGVQDVKKGYSYFKIAAGDSMLNAQYNLGVMYFKGYDTLYTDCHEAVEWLEMAAQRNHAKANYWLGKLYQEGNCVEKDPKMALQYYSSSLESPGINANLRSQIKEKLEEMKTDK